MSESNRLDTILGNLRKPDGTYSVLFVGTGGQTEIIAQELIRHKDHDHYSRLGAIILHGRRRESAKKLQTSLGGLAKSNKEVQVLTTEDYVEATLQDPGHVDEAFQTQPPESLAKYIFDASERAMRPDVTIFSFRSPIAKVRWEKGDLDERRQRAGLNIPPLLKYADALHNLEGLVGVITNPPEACTVALASATGLPVNKFFGMSEIDSYTDRAVLFDRTNALLHAIGIDGAGLGNKFKLPQKRAYAGINSFVYGEHSPHNIVLALSILGEEMIEHLKRECGSDYYKEIKRRVGTGVRTAFTREKIPSTDMGEPCAEVIDYIGTSIARRESASEIVSSQDPPTNVFFRGAIPTASLYIQKEQLAKAGLDVNTEHPGAMMTWPFRTGYAKSIDAKGNLGPFLEPVRTWPFVLKDQGGTALKRSDGSSVTYADTDHLPPLVQEAVIRELAGIAQVYELLSADMAHPMRVIDENNEEIEVATNVALQTNPALQQPTTQTNQSSGIENILIALGKKEGASTHANKLYTVDVTTGEITEEKQQPDFKFFEQVKLHGQNYNAFIRADATIELEHLATGRTLKLQGSHNSPTELSTQNNFLFALSTGGILTYNLNDEPNFWIGVKPKLTTLENFELDKLMSHAGSTYVKSGEMTIHTVIVDDSGKAQLDQKVVETDSPIESYTGFGKEGILAGTSEGQLYIKRSESEKVFCISFVTGTKAKPALQNIKAYEIENGDIGVVFSTTYDKTHKAFYLEVSERTPGQVILDHIETHEGSDREIIKVGLPVLDIMLDQDNKTPYVVRDTTYTNRGFTNRGIALNKWDLKKKEGPLIIELEGAYLTIMNQTEE